MCFFIIILLYYMFNYLNVIFSEQTNIIYFIWENTDQLKEPTYITKHI